MDFKKFFLKEASQIDQELLKYLAQIENDLNKISPLLTPLFEHFIEVNKNGKRLRALLLKLGYQMSGGKDTKSLLKPMLAVEIFHAAILAHDDIIDQSPLRRGRATMHHAMGNDHHAVSQTIVLADYGFFLANKLIAESQFDNSQKNQAFQIFNQIVLDTAIGEIIDVEIPFQKKIVTKKDADIIALYKTARYTFTGPLQMGAVLAGADQAEIKKIQQFGDNLGIAFQIQDDILGVFGQVDQTGKSNISDLEEGKATILAAFTLSKSSDKQRKRFLTLYGKANLNQNEVFELKQFFQETGALDMAYESALKYTSSAVSKIEDLKVDQKYKKILQELAGFLMERKK